MDRIDETSGRLTEPEFTQAVDFVLAIYAAKAHQEGNDWDGGRVMKQSGSIFQSRVRAKAAEVFAGLLLDVPIDLDIHRSGDGGVDLCFRGYYGQVKRLGTRTRKRGRSCYFCCEIGDPAATAERPSWDFGMLIEDHHEDPYWFRFAGWLSWARWVRERHLLNWQPRPCFGVTPLNAPLTLFRVPPRVPPRSWPIFRHASSPSTQAASVP